MASNTMVDVIHGLEGLTVRDRQDIRDSLVQSLEVKLCWLKEGLTTKRNFQGNETSTFEVQIDFQKPDGKTSQKSKQRKVCIRGITNTLSRVPNLHRKYLVKRCDNVEILFVGMNPAPNSPTGIPFYEKGPVTNFIGGTEFQAVTSSLSANDVDRTSDSGRRFWKLMRKEFGGDGQRFFDRCFVINYCPLIFTKQSGGNISLGGFDDHGTDFLKGLISDCDRSLRSIIEAISPKLIVTFGEFVYKRVKASSSDISTAAANPLNIRHPSPIADKDEDEKKSDDVRDKIWVDRASGVLKKKEDWISVTAT